MIGGGQIGEALIVGLLESRWARGDVIVVGRTQARVKAIGQRLGIQATTDTTEAVRASDLIVLAVKPHDVSSILTSLGTSELGAHHDRVLVSLAAGVSTAQMEARLPPAVPVVRAMPNTPMLVGQGITAIAPGRNVSEEQVGLVSRVLRTVGEVVTVEESQMDAVTAVSGSGPAYFFVIAEAMVGAAVELGLPRTVALQSVVQTMRGSAALLHKSGRPASELRAAVTSPAGTTEAALRELERSGLRSTFHEALFAAERRSAEHGAATA